MKSRLRASDTNRLWLDSRRLSYDDNLQSEGLGNWEDSLKQLLPFFAAGGRRNYTKCVTWLLSEKKKLDSETEAILKAGGFVVRQFRRDFP